MITYRAGYYVPTMAILTNLTHLFMSTPKKQDAGSFITINNSTFFNLNVFTSVGALAKYEGVSPMLTLDQNMIAPLSVPALIHKGIVLNIEDFGGKVEISESIFIRNMHYIPAVYYKYQDSTAAGNKGVFYDGQNTDEYQLTICSQKT